jgi:hypothetical protein
MTRLSVVNSCAGRLPTHGDASVPSKCGYALLQVSRAGWANIWCRRLTAAIIVWIGGSGEGRPWGLVCLGEEAVDGGLKVDDS